MNYIRKATKKDAYRIAEIIVFNYRINFYPIFKYDEFYFKDLQVINVAEEYLEKEEIINNTYVYDDGVVKGFIRLLDKEVKKLFVEPVLQGNGIGEKLLHYAMDNCDVNCLWTLEKNEKAIRFYQRNGFHLTNEKKFEADSTEYLIRLEL